MRTDHFWVLRYPIALVSMYFIAYAIALPSSLDRSHGKEYNASAVYSSYKGGQAVIQTDAGEELRFWCGQVAELCKVLENRSVRTMRVWISQDTILVGRKVIAAIEGEQQLLSERGQSAALLRQRIGSLVLGAGFALAAWALWYFRPSSRSKRIKNAA